MLTETTGRTPQDLAAELTGLRAVDDWPSVWSGPPQGGTPEFYAWCERYGWEPQTTERSLWVRTRSGGDWTLFPVLGGDWSPLASLRHQGWHLTAGSGEENPDVHTAAAETWSTYLEAAEAALGSPTWSGQWDSPDFPEPPHPAYWRDREERALSRNPFRFAYWAPETAVPGQPCITLSQSVSFQTWTTDGGPGASAVSVDVYAPLEFLAGDR
ncbi:hypothetical protein ABZZ17_08840 [Streptomyces sp. NPDC006512]|uniref:hypothetical protein n=1 Tax=Streptomyces sp. NPDC006512 TaxID=3154307 RepID=UPI0033A2DB65